MSVNRNIISIELKKILDNEKLKVVLLRKNMENKKMSKSY